MVYIITFAFILMDFVTGLIKSFASKSYNSSVMREGLFHKTGSIMVIVFGGLVDYAQGFMELGISIPVASSICIYICLMEIGSIIENVCVINPRIIPDKIQSYFHKLTEGKIETEKDVDTLDNIHSKKG